MVLGKLQIIIIFFSYYVNKMQELLENIAGRIAIKLKNEMDKHKLSTENSNPLEMDYYSKEGLINEVEGNICPICFELVRIFY